ncbi:MAG: hypothetical protein IPK02_05885 [Candidatus Accumulibacter sp.]|uniref:Uncharacterized protein n=1 Tax=Candidatus Accumulibacter affinis TaxID=2954384 RepID=A0A935T7D5_9PROT|nr:hypothetical protein [Candidatus Accumulibacter affinis]
MTSSERKRAQRMRDRRMAIDAIGHEADAPLRALLDLLGRVEDSEPARHWHDGHGWLSASGMDS